MVYYIDYYFKYIDAYGDEIEEPANCYINAKSIPDAKKKFKTFEKNSYNIRIFKLVSEMD